MKNKVAKFAFEIVGWSLVYGVWAGSEFWSNVAGVYFWMIAILGIVAFLGSFSSDATAKLLEEHKTPADHVLWGISLAKFVALTGLGWVAGGICLVTALLLKMRWWAAVTEKSA